MMIKFRVEFDDGREKIIEAADIEVSHEGAVAFYDEEHFKCAYLSKVHCVERIEE